jgi:hypothetical protein
MMLTSAQRRLVLEGRGAVAGPTPTVPGRIFISYRREETAYPAGWLYDRLADRFGSDQVFKDVDSIQLGDDFIEVITSAVGSCDVLLALIGDEWLTITDEHGGRRLDDPNDFVRLEIEAALTRNVRVIPILLNGATMPHANQLPSSLARLVRRQALELSPARFDFDTSRLLKVLDWTLAEAHGKPLEGTAPTTAPAQRAEGPSHDRAATTAVPGRRPTSSPTPTGQTASTPPDPGVGPGRSRRRTRPAGRRRRRQPADEVLNSWEPRRVSLRPGRGAADQLHADLLRATPPG